MKSCIAFNDIVCNHYLNVMVWCVVWRCAVQLTNCEKEHLYSTLMGNAMQCVIKCLHQVWDACKSDPCPIIIIIIMIINLYIPSTGDSQDKVLCFRRREYRGGASTLLCILSYEKTRCRWRGRVMPFWTVITLAWLLSVQGYKSGGE